MIERFRVLWCDLFHGDPRWPVNHFAECPDCLRRIPVPFDPPAAELRPRPVQMNVCLPEHPVPWGDK